MISRRELFKGTASALAATILPLDVLCAQAARLPTEMHVNALFQRKLLQEARKRAPYFMGSEPGTLVKHGGSATLTWKRYA